MKVTAVETILLDEFANLLWLQLHSDAGYVTDIRKRYRHKIAAHGIPASGSSDADWRRKH